MVPPMSIEESTKKKEYYVGKNNSANVRKNRTLHLL